MGTKEEDVVVVTGEVDAAVTTREVDAVATTREVAVAVEEVVEEAVEDQASMLLTQLPSHHWVRLLILPMEVGIGGGTRKFLRTERQRTLSLEYTIEVARRQCFQMKRVFWLCCMKSKATRFATLTFS